MTHICTKVNCSTFFTFSVSFTNHNADSDSSSTRMWYLFTVRGSETKEKEKKSRFAVFPISQCKITNIWKNQLNSEVFFPFKESEKKASLASVILRHLIEMHFLDLVTFEDLDKQIWRIYHYTWPPCQNSSLHVWQAERHGIWCTMNRNRICFENTPHRIVFQPVIFLSFFSGRSIDKPQDSKKLMERLGEHFLTS